MARHGSRMTAVLSGKGKEVGAIEAHERNVLAITRRIHTLKGLQSKFKKDLKAIGEELREKRRELRAVLQRDGSITDERLDLAGPADAVDASQHHAERRK